MSRRTLGSIALVLGLCACADDPSSAILVPPNGSGTGNSPAKQFYIDKVHPSLDLTCTWCHAAEEAGNPAPSNAPQWLALTAVKAYKNIEDYGTLIAHPENSMFILQGEHMGPALTSAQDALVREWLLMEVEERQLPSPEDTPPDNQPPAKTAEEALNEFAACMNIQVFTDTQMYLVAHQQTNVGPCRGCHSSGLAGAFLDDDQQLSFDMLKQRPYLLKVVTAQVQNGVFQDLVPSRRYNDKGVEICSYLEDQDPANDVYCHPKYVLNPNVNAALTAFYDATYSAWSEGNCAPDDGGAGGAGGGGGGGAGGGI